MQELSLAEARRIQLSQQGLIRPFSDPFEAVGAMVAVQTQYAASLPTAVAARTSRVRPGWDDAALVAGGKLIKSWSVRHTLHAHLPEDHALILAVVGKRYAERHRRIVSEQTGLDLEAVEARIQQLLTDEPRSRPELHEQIPELATIPWSGWGYDVAGLAYRGRLCIVGRGATQCFSLLERSAAEVEADPEGAMQALARRYFAAFGPATAADFAHWLGVAVKHVTPAVASLGDAFAPVAIAGRSERHWMRRDAVAVEGPLGVRLLAKFDPYVLAHQDKTLWLDPSMRSRVFRIAAQVEAVVLSQGRACGTWRLQRKAKQAVFVIEPFRELGLRERAGIQREAARMAKQLGFSEGSVEGLD